MKNQHQHQNQAVVIVVMVAAALVIQNQIVVTRTVSSGSRNVDSKSGSVSGMVVNQEVKYMDQKTNGSSERTNGIECGDFDSAISGAVIDLRDDDSGSDEKRLSFCDIQASESDNACNIQNNVDPAGDADIEIFVFNGDTLSTDQFSCLLPKGSNDDKFIYSPLQDGELLDIYFVPFISNEICDRNTSSPTSSPTPLPTPNPAPNPIPNPTPYPSSSPTNYLAVMVSNGCSTSGDEWTSMKSYLIEIIEKIYDPDTMNPILFTHFLDGTANSELIETRDDISIDINLLECGSPIESGSVIYDVYLAYILNGINTCEDTDEWVLLTISLCLPEDGSDICEEQSTYDPDGNVKIIVVNVGSDLVSSDDFSCLVDGGTSGENYNEYNDFDEASMSSNINGVRDEICENRALSPTGSPTPNPTGVPTNKPTSSPTYNYCDLGNTTMSLT